MSEPTTETGRALVASMPARIDFEEDVGTRESFAAEIAAIEAEARAEHPCHVERCDVLDVAAALRGGDAAWSEL